jgi:hypothetical protein
MPPVYRKNALVAVPPIASSAKAVRGLSRWPAHFELELLKLEAAGGLHSALRLTSSISRRILAACSGAVTLSALVLDYSEAGVSGRGSRNVCQRDDWLGRRGRIRGDVGRAGRRCRSAAASAAALSAATHLDRLSCRRSYRRRVLRRGCNRGFFGAPVTFSTNPSGIVGGLQAGYDYQFSPNGLIGAELELSWTSASGNFNFFTTTPAGTIATGTFNSNHNWYDTFTGRVGYVINDWVLYAKGGAASTPTTAWR